MSSLHHTVSSLRHVLIHHHYIELLSRDALFCVIVAVVFGTTYPYTVNQRQPVVSGSDTGYLLS